MRVYGVCARMKNCLHLMMLNHKQFVTIQVVHCISLKCLKQNGFMRGVSVACITACIWFIILPKRE